MEGKKIQSNWYQSDFMFGSYEHFRMWLQRIVRVQQMQ